MVKMTRFVLPLVIVFFVFPLQSNAQQWTPQQQEVLDNLAECWTFWEEGVESGSPEKWIRECAVPGQTYWWSPDGAPLNIDYTRRVWAFGTGTEVKWDDIRPVSITVSDDVAVLHFYGYWRSKADDDWKIVEAKRTEIFRRVDGRWKMIAGHSSPVTSEDED